MKALMLLCDGMGDRRCVLLGGLTPLQAARTPTFDRIASLGECGIMDTIAPGVVPGSDTGHLAILGYDPHRYYSGRGAYEALGAGLELGRGDVAFRCNFATVNNEGVVADRRAGRIAGEDVEKLTDAVRELDFAEYADTRILFHHTVEHRGVLILRGPGLSRMVSNVDVHATGVPLPRSRGLDESDEARRTADILNTFVEKTREILWKHPVNEARVKAGKLPANAILPRGAGVLPEVEPINSKYGLKAAVVAGGPLYKGVCKALGFDVLDVPGATGTIDTNLQAKMRAAVGALRENDFVFLHVKGTDTASHNRNPDSKVRMIRRIDQAFDYVLNNVDPVETYVVITADHTTPVEIGDHQGDPVPVAVYGHDVRSDNVTEFNEISCARGGLGRIRGIDLMPIITSYLGKAIRFGE